MPPCRAAIATAQAPRVTRDLFDRKLRALRRDRAAAMGPELFLLDRAFDDCLDRLRTIAPQVERALLIGCPSASWPDRLGELADEVDIIDPGPIFASRAGGTAADEDRFDFGEGSYDLCLAVGTLDTVNELPLALHMIHRSLRPNGLLVGAIAGGNSLPALRAALIEGDRLDGACRCAEPTLASSLPLLRGFSPPPVLRCRWSTSTASACAIPVLATWSAIFGPWGRPACWRSARLPCRRPPLAVPPRHSDRRVQEAGPRNMWKFSIFSAGANIRSKRPVNLLRPS